MARHVVYKGPSIIKEIVYGLSISLFAGLLWKRHHWNVQKRRREFYDMLDRGEASGGSRRYYYLIIPKQRK